MAYRLIYSEFWTDPKVMEEMTPEDRYFYLYLLTNGSTTHCGIYLITKKQMAFELGYSIEAVNSLMDRFENHHGLIIYNPETRELALKNWGKYNLNRGGKPVIDCLSSELSKIKDKTLINYVLKNISNDAIKNLYRSFCDSPTNREGDVERQGDNTNTDTNTNTYTYTERDTERYINLNTTMESKGNSKEFRSKSTVAESNSEIKSDNDIHSLSISLLQEYEKLTGQMGFFNLASIKAAIKTHGYDNVKKAMDTALTKGKLNLAYVNGILKTWAAEGYPSGGDNNGTRSHSKSDNKFKGLKLHKPRTLTEEERRKIGEEIL
jgi:DnaD/phage-associated family protein